MKKALICLVSILIISLGIGSIYMILKPKDEINEPNSSIEQESNFVLTDDTSGFKSYRMDNMNFDSYLVSEDKIKISFWDKKLIVNDYEIDEVTYVNSYVALFDDSLLAIMYRDSKGVSRILEFNVNTNDYIFINALGDELLLINENSYFSTDGINLNTNLVINKKIKVGKKYKDICSITDMDTEVGHIAKIYYNFETKLLDSSELLDIISLGQFLSDNNICE